jgi:protein-S-isoprenylcysteine O-methyltransferase Ste14
MRPLSYTDEGAKIAFYVVLGLFGASEWSIRIRSHLNRGGAPQDRGSFYLIIATAGLGIVGAFALAFSVTWAGITVAPWPVFVSGLALIVFGIAIRQWAVFVLGKFFTVQVRVQPDQRVVESGPYRWVRHPSYTGIIASFVGIGVGLGNWLSLLVLIVVPTIGLVIRIRVEEQALTDVLGEPYERFVATRARLIPGVW